VAEAVVMNLLERRQGAAADRALQIELALRLAGKGMALAEIAREVEQLRKAQRRRPPAAGHAALLPR